MHNSTIRRLQQKLLSWYAQNKRELPWRKTKNPYAILVSEIMLQQTQVDRVIPYYHQFLNQFPDWESLAKAKKAALLACWSGLGYNSRVLRLQQTARAVVDQHKGILPRNRESLLKLPGIGPYTASAVLAFAFNKPIPVIDTNIRRVLLYELGLKKDPGLAKLEALAGQCIPKNKSRIWHNALMDYGAIILTAKKTGIGPLSKQSRFKGSDREVRGWVMKQLVKHKTMSFHQIRQAFPQKKVESIVKKMQEEGLLSLRKKQVVLQE